MNVPILALDKVSKCFGAIVIADRIDLDYSLFPGPGHHTILQAGFDE